jgi:hypothetical protein
MKQPIPWSARWRAWWHEAFTGHRVAPRYMKGKYQRLSCEHRNCFKTFHRA